MSEVVTGKLTSQTHFKVQEFVFEKRLNLQ